MWETVLVLLIGIVAAVVLGAVPAHVAARRLPRDEARMETDQHEPRPMPRSVLGILVRTDRASVWRSVPMRRGVLVLAVGPGLVALFGNLQWAQMTILPGLVASGGALLFGVNAWCLDGRGALWRENLPAPATTLFDARALVLAEFLGVASLITILVGALRAGVPNAQELAALVATLVVVTLQVVGAALRWSLLHPYPVDLRSARATPAPPAAMVGYSARLATSTTFTGLVFSGCAHVPDWRLSLIVAMPCLLWSGDPPGAHPPPLGGPGHPRAGRSAPSPLTHLGRHPPTGRVPWTSPRRPGPPTSLLGWPSSWPPRSRRSSRPTTATSPRHAVPATRGRRCRCSASSRRRRGSAGCGTCSCRRSTPVSTPRASAPTAARG